jgi:hypothetical protein
LLGVLGAAATSTALAVLPRREAAEPAGTAAAAESADDR